MAEQGPVGTVAWPDDTVERHRRLSDAVPLRADAAAAITIDMQRDYLDGSVGTNLLDAADRESVVAAASAFLAKVRRHGIPVVHAYVQRRPVELDNGVEKTRYAQAARRLGVAQNPRARADGGKDRPSGSTRAEVAEPLVERGDIHVPTKKTMDAFLHTDLDHLVSRVLKVDALMILGVNTETCVLATALAVANRGLVPVVIADCVASIRGRFNHEAALALMAGSFAWVLDSATAARNLDR